MAFISYIQPANIHTFNYNDFLFEITINGVGMRPRGAEQAPERDARWAVTYFTLVPYQLEALKSAKSFGARHVRSEGIFLGFEYQLEDNKLSDLVAGCRSPATIAKKGRSRNNQSILPLQKREPILLEKPKTLPNTDFPGGDYDSLGVRGIEIDQCAEICRGMSTCLAISWVEKSLWCWPKQALGDQKHHNGVSSQVIRQ